MVFFIGGRLHLSSRIFYRVSNALIIKNSMNNKKLTPIIYDGGTASKSLTSVTTAAMNNNEGDGKFRKENSNNKWYKRTQQSKNNNTSSSSNASVAAEQQRSKPSAQQQQQKQKQQKTHNRNEEKSKLKNSEEPPLHSVDKSSTAAAFSNRTIKIKRLSEETFTEFNKKSSLDKTSTITNNRPMMPMRMPYMPAAKEVKTKTQSLADEKTRPTENANVKMLIENIKNILIEKNKPEKVNKKTPVITDETRPKENVNDDIKKLLENVKILMENVNDIIENKQQAEVKKMTENEQADKQPQTSSLTNRTEQSSSFKTIKSTSSSSSLSSPQPKSNEKLGIEEKLKEELRESSSSRKQPHTKKIDDQQKLNEPFKSKTSKNVESTSASPAAISPAQPTEKLLKTYEKKNKKLDELKTKKNISSSSASSNAFKSMKSFIQPPPSQSSSSSQSPSNSSIEATKTVAPPKRVYSLSNQSTKKETKEYVRLSEKNLPYDTEQNLDSGEGLLIFRGDLKVETKHPNADSSPIWLKYDDNEFENSIRLPFKNAFDEMIELTNQGKLWRYPIDNEQECDESEANIPFYEHVFLDDYLKEFPDIQEVQDFMTLVLNGLSKNGHLKLSEKREIINWYKEYFQSKMDVIKQSFEAERLEAEYYRKMAEMAEQNQKNRAK